MENGNIYFSSIFNYANITNSLITNSEILIQGPILYTSKTTFDDVKFSMTIYFTEDIPFFGLCVISNSTFINAFVF